jgi:DNA replication protein DnaC
MNSIIEPQKVVSAPPVELPEETFECPKHGPYSGKPMVLAFLGNKKISPLCPQCEVEHADAEERLGQKRRTAADMKKLADMNILKRDWGCDFDNFNAYTAELAKHVKTARAFAEKPDGKLVMLGNNGTGKNHLATSILRRTGGVIYTAYEIGLRLRQSYGGDSKEWEVLNALSEINMLVIDEIGRTKARILT